MSFKGFSEVTLPNGGHGLCNTSRPASYASSSVLAQSPCSTSCLAPGLILHQGRPSLRQIFGSLDNPCLFQTGVQLGLTSKWKVVTTDSSTSGWGVPLEGNPVFGSWSVPDQVLHINCLKMLVVFLALKSFLPALRGQNVLVQSHSMMVVVYINHQGGLGSHSLYRMAHHLFFWVQSPCSTPRLTPMVILHQGRPSLCKSFGSLDNPSTTPVPSSALVK